MTSAFESGRFEATCTSGSSYTIIEKTRETKESKILTDQIVCITKKSYSLSTGEKVNKITELDYIVLGKNLLITRTVKPSKNSFVSDIKTLFDYLKNQALCIAIVLAVPEIMKLFSANQDSLEITSLRGVTLLCAIATAGLIAVVFSAYNLIWLFSSLEDKPRKTILHYLIIFFTLAFVAAVMFLAFFKSYTAITH